MNPVSHFCFRKNLNTIEIVDDDLKLKSNLNGNKQIVRCSWYNREVKINIRDWKIYLTCFL